MVGLELATTVDKNLNEYLSPHIKSDEKSQSFHRINNLETDIHNIGTLCNITEINQQPNDIRMYKLVHLEGLSPIKVKKEIIDVDFKDFFLDNAINKIKR